MNKKSLYPERQRCAKCRKAFALVVVDGIYDSYACAGIRAPSTRLSDTPRECKRMVNDKWDFKQRYRSEEEVPLKLRNDPGTNIYRCQNCHHLHVGHSRPDQFQREKLNRIVGDAETLGTVLQRMREDRKWSVRKLSEHLKVPQVRIREIEEGHPNANLNLAIKALYAVGLRMILRER